MSSRLIVYILMSLGVLLSIAGVVVVAYKDVEVEYITYYVTIPEYRFDTLMPGNYTETKRIDLEFARMNWYTSEPVNWIYNISALPWQNCVGDNLIGVTFKSRSTALEPKLLLEIDGCRNNTREQLVLSDLLVDPFTVKVEYEYVGKAIYTLNETILD